MGATAHRFVFLVEHIDRRFRVRYINVSLLTNVRNHSAYSDDESSRYIHYPVGNPVGISDKDLSIN